MEVQELVSMITNSGGLIAMAVVMYKLYMTQRDDRNKNEESLRELIEKQNESFSAQDMQLQAITLTQEKIIEEREPFWEVATKSFNCNHILNF